MQANPELLKSVTQFIRNDKMKASLGESLGHLNIRVDVGRMQDLFLSYCSRQPRLLECSKQTLFDALKFITQCGLEPILGQVYLVPFRNNKSGETDCQVIIGYKGLVVLAIRSGMVSHVEARVVYECDCRSPGAFDLDLGDTPRLIHKPNWRERIPNSEMVGAYCIVTLTNGHKITDFMNKAEIEAIKNRSRAKDDGPWITDPSEMWKKTVTKRTLKYTPVSIEDLNVKEFDGMEGQVPADASVALPLASLMPALPAPQIQSVNIPPRQEMQLQPVSEPAQAPEAQQVEQVEQVQQAPAPATETQERPKGTNGLKDELKKRRGRPKKADSEAPVQASEAATEPVQTAAPAAPAAVPAAPAAVPAAPAAVPAAPAKADPVDLLLKDVTNLPAEELRIRTVTIIQIARQRVPDKIDEVLRDNLIESEDELKTIGRLALRNVLLAFGEALKGGT
jgi:phage RecT family recombinase